MNLSRFSVIAVFFMMIMSAFVTVPTFNVGADEEAGEDDDEGPYLNTWPSTGEDYEMSTDDVSIFIMAANLTNGTSYTISWLISKDSNDELYLAAEGYWDFSVDSSSKQYFLDPNYYLDDDLGPGCYMFEGWLFDNDADEHIEYEIWPFTLDMPFSDCWGSGEGGCMNYDDTNGNGLYDEGEPCYDDENGGECPFDEDNPDSPCNAQECIDHESQECANFIENYCANNEDSYCGAAGMDMVCYDVATHEINFDIRTAVDCEAAGLMWVSPISGPDDGRDDRPVAFHATMTMKSLEEWTVDYNGEMPVDWSNDMRNEMSNMCEMMMGTDFGEISQECFDYWVDMSSNGGHDDHGEHDDEFTCPSDMDDAACATFMECSENDSMSMDCFRAMYNYCYDNTDSEMCEEMMSSDEDDGGQFIWGIVAYEAGHIDAATLMDEYIIPEFGDFMDDGTSDSTDSGNAVLYDVQTFNMDSDGELIIHPQFMEEIITTPDFVCGNEQTIDFRNVNDGEEDCDDGSDEQQYDDNADEINWFDCHDGTEISMTLVNDYEWNCGDGEDEYHEHYHSWWGEVYLFEGDYSAGLTDFNNLENIAFKTSHQEWKDENKTDINYESFTKADISAGTWSLVTIGSCHTEWGEDDEGNWVLVGYDCHGENGNHTNSGSYSHKLEFGSESWLVNGSIDHESMEMANFPYMDNYDDDQTEFLMYHTQSFSIDQDSSVSIFSAGWNCYDYDEDGVDDDCWGNSPGLYIYHDEDLIASNKHYHSENLFCPIDSEDQDYSNCNYAMLEVDLVAGDYTIYTTFDSEASYYNNIDGAYVVFEGEESDDWGGHMEDNHWEWHETDGDEVMQTVAYDGSVYDLDYEAFWSEAYDFEWNDAEENPKAVEEEFGSVYELYENYENVLETEGEGCDGCTGNLEEMDADTSFDITNQNDFENWTYNYDFEQYYFQFMDDNENGVYDSGEIYAVSSEGPGDSEDQYVLVEGTADRKHMPRADQAEYEPYCTDEDGNVIECDDVFEMFAYMFMIAENATHYEEGDLTAVEAADNSVELFYMLVDAGMFERGEDDHDHHGDDPNGDEPGLHHHGDEDYHHQHGDSDTSSHADYDRHHDHDDNHGDHDDHGDHNGHDDDERDEDDNPPLLDGIVGVGGEDVEPLPLALNVVGSLVDNEDTPIMMGASFNLIFEGADESLDVHSVYIPIEDDVPWHIEMILLEGYEVKSCEGCEDLEIDGNRANFHSNEPVMVMFGKAATTEECDQTVTIGEGGYTFEPAEITISVGDTVCWIWENTADVHNVIAVTDLDSLVNLESGFNSGEPSQTVDFRYTFTEDSMTYYYVCEPHATMGMVGTVTVGTGSEDDRIPEIIDDSGLPNVSFIVGALVLVGAAGLRRRIH